MHRAPLLLLAMIPFAACDCGGAPGPDAGPGVEDAGDPPPLPRPFDAGPPPPPPPPIDAGPPLCPPDDDEEPNDARADATGLDLAGETIDGISCPDNDDWFRVEAIAGCEVEGILTLVADEAGDVDLHLFDDSGTILDVATNPVLIKTVSATGAGGRAFRVRGVTPRTYSFEVRSVCPVDLQCPADDSLEENDAADAPSALPLGQTTQAIACSGDDDFFSVAAPVGCAVAVDVEFTDVDGDIDVHLFDGEDRVEQSTTTTDDERVVEWVDQGERVVRVFGFNGAENTYNITPQIRCESDLGCAEDDLFEPNDDAAGAFRLRFPTRDGAAGILCGDNDDFFRFAGTAGCEVQLVLRFLDDSGDLDLRLRDNDGSVLAAAVSVSDDETITHTLATGGNKVIQVSAIGAAENTYTLELTQTCP